MTERPDEELQALLQLIACGQNANPGCCSRCDGTGNSGEYETGSMCSDCYATGHNHGPVEDLVALGDFLDAVRRAVDKLDVPSLLARVVAAEKKLAAVEHELQRRKAIAERHRTGGPKLGRTLAGREWWVYAELLAHVEGLAVLDDATEVTR